jgi:predicted nucleic acid-binding protein
MAGVPYLLDTNVLLRLVKSNDPGFPLARSATRGLKARGDFLFLIPQNIVEFWNVCTRPQDRNGYGLSPPDANERARRVERAFTLIPDNEFIHPQWRRIVLDYSVSGAQVHDARLVAAMYVHGITHLLTFDDRDFARYAGITVVHPGRILPQAP